MEIHFGKTFRIFTYLWQKVTTLTMLKYMIKYNIQNRSHIFTVLFHQFAKFIIQKCGGNLNKSTSELVNILIIVNYSDIFIWWYFSHQYAVQHDTH